ncbi:MAG: Electron transport protein HydN [Candidatus Heimdallarchaeota archaeon LC_3]|nr:MAG: Electron transport protein HydN [Candidatus Heimdallarchaeota archaeon LC_3]
MRIKVDMNKCNGCRLCEAVCSTVSNIKEKSGILNPDISAIKINYDKFKRNDTAIVCYQCKKAHCMDICSTRALFRSDGTILLDPSLCTGCEDCITACASVFTISMISFSPQEEKIIKCDLCSKYSFQYCIESCPVEAISLVGKK